MDMSPSITRAEARRLAALRALDLLDTAPEPEFDAIARLAATATGCETAFIALIDATRMWVKASVGSIPCVVPRADSLCDTIIRTDAPLIVDDLAADPRFHDHWVVAAGSRFYAGMPIRTAGTSDARHAVGTLCVLDTEPRHLDPNQQRAFEDLVGVVEALIVARRGVRDTMRHAAALERQHRVFRQAERMTKVGWWRLTLDDDQIEWSDGVFRIHELEQGRYPALSEALDFYPPQARAAVSAALASAIETGQPYDLEVDFTSAKGNARRVRSIGEVEWGNGRPSAIVGVFHDVTEEHALKLALQRSADTDPLTGMANRNCFTRALDAAIDAAIADGSPLALALIDLDGFKRINDTFGHPAGDEVLKTVARQLRAPWLKGSCASRLGGDEFALVVDDARLLDDSETLVARLESALQVSTKIGGLTLESGASVGLMHFDPERFASRHAFVQAADAALYAAKRQRVGERRAA